MFVIEGPTPDYSALVRGINLDGRPVWTTPLIGLPSQPPVPDALGGLIYPFGSSALVRIDGITGQPSWEVSDRNAVFATSGQMAGNADGTVFVLRNSIQTSYDDLIALDAATGQMKFVVNIPQSFDGLTVDGQVGDPERSIHPSDRLPRCQTDRQ